MIGDYLQFLRIPVELKGKVCLDLSGFDDLSPALKERGAVVTDISDNKLDMLPVVSGIYDYIFIYLDQLFNKDTNYLFSFLKAHLKDSGLLFVDSTVLGSLFEKRWAASAAAGNLVVAPTFRELTENFFAGFSARDLGRMPAGLRSKSTLAFVCRKLSPIVVLVGGPSGIGKTTLCREFSRAGVPVLNFDFLYSEIAYHAQTVDDQRLRELASRIDTSRLGTSIDNLVTDGFTECLVDLTIPYFSLSNSLVMAEGYQFSVAEIARVTRNKLEEKGFRVEMMTLG